MIFEHIKRIDEELEKATEMHFKVELLKAKSTALLAQATKESSTIKLINGDKVFKVMSIG